MIILIVINKEGINYYDSTLCSVSYGYFKKKYGLKKGKGEYIHTRDTNGVIMDVTKGDHHLF